MKQTTKTIKLFEAFAGIGAQYQALENISNKMNWNIEVVGIIEWFIPAIIAYNHLHSNQTKISIASRERERVC